MEDIVSKYSLNVIREEIFDDNVVYILDEKSFLRLWDMKIKKAKELQELGFDFKKAFEKAYSNEFKILNKDKNPLKIVSFGYMAKYSLVVDKEKVLEKYLDKQFYAWANHLRKQAKKEIKQLGIDNVGEIQRYLDKTEAVIKEAETLKDDVKQNPDNYKIIMTNLEKLNELYKPVVYLKEIKSGKTFHQYLRKIVPHFLYETIEIPRKRKPRKLEVIKELKTMTNPFGKIYIKLLKGE